MKQSLKQFFTNLALYLAIALAIYYLYSPLNDHANNLTRSAISFVYQQF